MESSARRWLAGLLAVCLALGGSVAAGTAASAEVLPAGLSVDKTGPSGDDLPLTPGEPFNYVITVQCSYAVPNSGCYDATVTDAIPAPLEIAGTPTVVSEGNTAEVSVDGNDVTVDFTTPFLNTIDPGAGMLGGTTATITVPVVVPADTDYDFSGEDIVNTAEFSASNPDTDPAADDHAVVIEVPLEPATDVSKSFSPDQATAGEGTPTTISIDATNDSGTGADSLVITDPAPGSDSTTFDYLALDSITITEIPEGADQIVVSVDTGGGMSPVGTPIDVDSVTPPVDVDLSGVALEDVVGIQVEFVDTEEPRIADGASAGVDVDVVQRDPGELTDDVLVDNTAGSEVSRDGESGTDTGDADYSITTNIPTVDAGKSFEPDQVLHGESSTATITAGVTGELDVESLTVTEPSNGTFSEAMSFEGFVDPIIFPEGAEEATITYTEGGTFTFIPGEAVPLPADLAAVESFSLTFEDTDGSGIIAGGTPAEIPITVGTDADDTAPVTDLPNEVEVTGTTPDGVNGSDAAEDTLHAFDEHIDSTTDKSITPGSITGWDGEWIVMQLSGGTAGSPVDGNTDDPYSSIPTQQIVVQDPVDPTAPDAFWDAFDPTQLVDINIPADASLTVNYWDGDAWVPLAGPLDSSDSPWTYDIPANAPPSPEDIGGLQFQYDYAGDGEGFPPGTTFQPNVVMNFDPDAADTSAWDDDNPAVFTNCASASAVNGDVESGLADPACDDVEVIEPDPNGGGASIDKIFVDGSGNEDPSVPARSHQVTHAHLVWSTGGQANVESMTLTDEADSPAANLAGTVFDTFDVTQIGPIDASLDPLLQYDAIDAVLIYSDDAGDWVEPTNSPCGPLDDGGGPEFVSECAGTLPAIALTDAEQADTLGVRIVYVENPDARTDALAPPVGSGVARSTEADGRTAAITFRVRDWLRSELPDLEAVDGADVYNVTGETGLVDNTASATASITDADHVTVDDSAQIVITEPDLSVATTKTWDGSPVGVPPENTLVTNYPTTSMSLTVTNSSTIVYVDELRITDRPAEDRPVDDEQVLMSDVFDITGFDDIDLPAGADTAVVTVYDQDGNLLLDSTVDGDPLSWSAPDLEDAAGFEVVFLGRDGDAIGGPGDPTTGGIEPQETGGIDLSLRLRQTDRYRGEAVDADYLASHGEPDPVTGDPVVPVDNASVGQVDDAGLADEDDPPTADASASVDLTVFDIGVAVQKEFSDLDGSNASDLYTQVETVDGSRPQFRMTLTATPTDGARPIEMQISDLDPSFWNAYEFVGIHPDFERAEPIGTVEMAVCTGPALSGSLDGPISGGCQRTIAADDSVTYSGTIESDGPTTGTPTLPAGVNPEDVIGLVFTFSSDEVWENPWNPVQEVPIIVQRREEMLTPAETAPPTDLAGNDPAPGEEAAGRWVNEVDASITALLNDAGGTDDGIHAVAAPDEAIVEYAHSVTAADVVKTPDGDSPLSLSGPTTFTLAFANTGDTPIYNPVFTDVLPTDVDGPLLMVDPSPAASGNSPYTFTLDSSGADPLPAGWTELPTDEADITIAPDPAVAGTEQIEFSFDGDYALGVGETFTITVQMLPRAGLSPEVFFTNTAVIDGGRPFDYCSTPPFDAMEAQALETCEGEATNSVAAGGALRSGKFVRAGTAEEPDYTFGALNVVDPGAECVPNVGGAADGFYTTPCVPRTAPGQTETWRLVLRNTGNVPLSQIIAVDRFPDVGDGTALNPSIKRGSAWAPELVDAAADLEGPAGDTVEVYVTEDEEPCTDVIEHTGDCNGSWVLADEYAGDLAELNGVMYIVNFAEGQEIQPTEIVWIEAESSTPATAPELTDPTTSSPDPIAWNTVATSATTDGGTDLLATEGNAAGVALVTGAIEFSKVVTGEGAEPYAPDTFEVTVECTSLGELVFQQTYTVADGDDPVVVDNLPYGAECTLVEGDEGQTTATVTPQSVTVPDGSVDDPAAITITNDYLLASLRLTKEVVAEGGSNADPDAAGPFTLGAICRLDGAIVTAPADQVELPSGDAEYSVLGDVVMVITGIRHEDQVVLGGLPAGAECVAGESDATDADRVGIAWQTVDSTGATVDEGTAVGEPVDGAFVSDLFELQPDAEGIDNGPTANDVLVVNQYAEGSLAITKQIEGGAADEHSGETFTVDVMCVYERDGEDDIVTFDGPVEVVAGETVTIDGIIVGSECTVTEPEDGRNGADQWIFDPAGDDTATGVAVVTDDTENPVEITVTNIFEDTAGLIVTKTVADDPLNDGQGGVPEVGPFPMSVECAYAEGTPYEREILANGFETGPMENDLSDGEIWILRGLPVGTVCTVTETDAMGATGTEVVASNDNGPVDPSSSTSTDIEITANGLAQVPTSMVEFVNTFPTGSLQVAKRLTGDGADERGAGPFTLQVECTSDDYGDEPITTWSGDVVLGGGAPLEAQIDGILAPSDCVVTETDDGGADAVTMLPGGPGNESASVTVTPEGEQGIPALVVAVNRFEPFASLAITKTVADTVQDADGQLPDLGPYVVRVQCLYDPVGEDQEPYRVFADGYGLLNPMILVLDADETVVLTGIPATSECTVTELGTGGASTTMTVTTADAGPDVTDGTAATVVLTPDDEAGEPTSTVEVTNTYGAGALTLDKVIAGPDVPQNPGPFTFQVECTLERDDRDPVSTWSGEVVLGGDQPLSATIDGIVAGSTCEVTETDAGDADQATLSPAAGSDATVAAVTIGAGAAVTVTATNTFDDELAATGFDQWWLVAIGSALLVIGVVLVAIRRRGEGR